MYLYLNLQQKLQMKFSEKMKFMHTRVAKWKKVDKNSQFVHLFTESSGSTFSKFLLSGP